MKKKVLALVVLAAMLVSILPFAAFAATFPNVSASSSRVIVTTETADADGNDEVELDIMVVDASGKPITGTYDLYVYSSRSTADTFYADKDGDGKLDKFAGATGNPDGDGIWTIQVTTDAAGWADLNVTSMLSGSRRLYVGTKSATDLKNFVNGDASAITAGVIPCYEGNTAVDYASYTFEATDNYEVVFEGANAKADPSDNFVVPVRNMPTAQNIMM